MQCRNEQAVGEPTQCQDCVPISDTLFVKRVNVDILALTSDTSIKQCLAT